MASGRRPRPRAPLDHAAYGRGDGRRGIHLDGRSRRPLPYSERRALPEKLALDGPAWRTPASVVVERSEDFVARVRDLGLEGVVAKRLNSTYLPGRRSTSWLKHKLRCEEHLAVTGVRRTREGHMEAIFVARSQPDGSFTAAGAVELGLHREPVEQLEGSSRPLRSIDSRSRV